MKFYIYTLGCKVNNYESNVMRDSLINHSYIETDNRLDADVVIINTCSVTNTADKKSLKTVRQAIKEHQNAIIVVTGCLSQNKKEVFESLEGVDIVLGNINKSKIFEYIDEYQSKLKPIIDVEDISDVEFEPMVLNNFNQTRAYVKIQDGCNNYCAYCIIPYVRGNVRSKKVNDVINEITDLVNNGHKEIVLTGIHTGNYGKELNTSLAELIKEIRNINGLERLRISSIEITELDDNFMDVLKNTDILVDHMHIPLQSGSNKTLKDMNRKYDKEYFIKKIESIRSIRPDISITTDVIVGFPGETEDNFKETVETIKTVNFSKIHVFPYSKREGTVAADMENQVDENIKKERVSVLLKLSKELEINYMNKHIDSIVSFLPETYKDGYIIGHTGNFLLVKCTGTKEDLNKIKNAKLDSVNYPYNIGNLI